MMIICTLEPHVARPQIIEDEEAITTGDKSWQSLGRAPSNPKSHITEAQKLKAPGCSTHDEPKQETHHPINVIESLPGDKDPKLDAIPTSHKSGQSPDRAPSDPETHISEAQKHQAVPSTHDEPKH